jgi:hypothetical protein
MGTDNYETGLLNPTHGIGVPLLDATTVTGDASGDTMAGGPGRDWFYSNLALDTYDWDPQTQSFIAV